MISQRTSSHIIPGKASVAFLFVCTLILGACSINLTTLGKTASETSSEFPLFREINLYYAGQRIPLPDNTLQAYSAALDSSAYPADKCQATADILVTIEKPKRKSGSAWYIGSLIVPFWPAQPVNEDWIYKLSAKIYCEQSLIHNFEFTESAHIQAFWYGALRSDLVNKASQEMHRKFMDRLKFETSDTRQADLNSASDYIQ